MADALEAIRVRNSGTPQSEQADPRQVQNSAGGWAFPVGSDVQLHRFLTIGTTGGTYYISEPKLTRENAKVVIDWATHNTQALVAEVLRISEAGRAPRNDQALFALAAAIGLGDIPGKQAAAAVLPRIARTGYHLFTFCKYAEQFGGWGPVLRRAVTNWYVEKDPDRLAYQLVKYRQRQGWSHRDVARVAHPLLNMPQRRPPFAPEHAVHQAIFDWLCGRDNDSELVPGMIRAYERAWEIEKAEGRFKVKRYVNLIHENPGLPWEALPDEAVTMPDVWRALIDAGLPMTALLRQLPRLTNLGVLDNMGTLYTRVVTDQLRDPERLLKARVHPAAILLALKTYGSGHGEKQTWTPLGPVMDALDESFYNAFPAVEPSGKATMVNTDISGSMTMTVGGYPYRACEMVGAMAMVQLHTEPEVGAFGFNTQLVPLPISKRMRLDSVMRTMFEMGGFGTDCAQPLKYAIKNKLKVETFQMWTDSETWHGVGHVHELLREYRQKSGIDARLVVAAVYANNFTVADPADPRTLDVSGFDQQVPKLIADFSRGDL
jgi:60 kDa SS-A/Ro ribonucleoprotein